MMKGEKGKRGKRGKKEGKGGKGNDLPKRQAQVAGSTEPPPAHEAGFRQNECEGRHPEYEGPALYPLDPFSGPSGPLDPSWTPGPSGPPGWTPGPSATC